MYLCNLFKILENKGIKAKKLSEDTGISTGNISDWKSGRSMPTSQKLIVLADYLDCSIDYLLEREERTQAPPQIQKVGRNISVEDQSTLDLYLQLDLYDKGEIRGEMKQMLKADKYREEILEKNA